MVSPKFPISHKPQLSLKADIKKQKKSQLCNKNPNLPLSPFLLKFTWKLEKKAVLEMELLALGRLWCVSTSLPSPSIGTAPLQGGWTGSVHQAGTARQTNKQTKTEKQTNKNIKNIVWGHSKALWEEKMQATKKL